MKNSEKGRICLFLPGSGGHSPGARYSLMVTLERDLEMAINSRKSAAGFLNDSEIDGTGSAEQLSKLRLSLFPFHCQ